MEQANLETLVSFFKVLGNDTRLRIVGMLAEKDLTVGEIAERLDLREPTVSEHLAKLKELDLVTVRPEGNFRLYSFNPKPLYIVNRDLFSRERLASLVENAPANDEAKTLRTFIKNDRIVQIPTGHKRLLVILRWLVEKFEVDRRYTEKEVNEIISNYHEDYATLRRELVDWHFMAREKGIYWRTPEASQDNVVID
ncbi:MAG TPA: metalloregulator ArsR/SmtB family transcription factor [Oceanobacillus sp.]|nr:metalloregulator ArsR/SmtB family transcription factor [Oceanobacillus sp.]